MKDFFIELHARFNMESPYFFKVIQKISIVTGTIAGLPELISKFQTELGIALPLWLTNFSNEVIIVSAIIAWIIAKLPVKNPGAIQNGKYGIIKRLPLTNKQDK